MAEDLTQWEYRNTNLDIDKLNELGKQGWEVTGVDSKGIQGVILKRPIKQPQQQPSRPKDDDRYYGR